MQKPDWNAMWIAIIAEVLVVPDAVVAQGSRQRQQQVHPEQGRDDDLLRAAGCPP